MSCRAVGRRGAWAVAISAAMACGAAEALQPAHPDEGAIIRKPDQHEVEILSKTYTIDRIYKSMEGPYGIQKFSLLEGAKPELLWITKYRVVVVGPDGDTPANQEFMCHNNLDFLDVAGHYKLFGSDKHLSSRLFTLSQGQFTIDLPKGFGVPMLSNEPLEVTTQVLNHNLDHQIFQARHQITIDFMRDRDLQAPLKPLFSTSAFGMALVQGDSGYYGVKEADKAKQGPGCLPGLHAPNGTSTGLYHDQFGRTFTGHWVVKPGREVNHTLVTKIMNLPFDTTIHYIAIHLHPFAESLELRDLTTKKTVFTSHVRNFPDRIGLEEVESFSSEEGLPVFKDHEYELVSVYNNTTPVNQDSMATMFFYCLDKEFMKPAL